MTKKITKQAARLYLLGQLLLKSNVLPTGKEGFVKLLNTLRHIQIDPLTQIGRSHELVALARVDGLKLDSFHELMGGTHGFEHWAKERCLLPAYALPYYLNYEYAQSSWFSLEKRKSCLSEEVLDSVLQEIEKRGPIESSKLEDRGKVKHNAEWIKTKDDQRDANKIAVEALWLMCKIVIVGRNSKNQKIYHVTKKIFPDIKKKNITEKEFVIWALKERIEAAGFLSRAASIAWSALGKYRTSEIIDELIKDGQIEEVVIEGSRAKYLAPKDFDKRQFPDFDDRLRIIAPLDPVIWDKKLVQFLFDFKYEATFKLTLILDMVGKFINQKVNVNMDIMFAHFYTRENL